MELFIGKSSTSHTRFCDVPECTQTTREGKPYCPDHVENHPYVQNLLQNLAEREDEEEKVRQRGAKAVNPDGLTIKEIVLHLSLHGARTVERLAREMNLDSKVLDGYIASLKRRGVISFSRTNRGSTVVKLTKIRTYDGTIIDADEEASDEAAKPVVKTKKQESAA